VTNDEILEALDGEIARLREARELLSGVEQQGRRGSGKEGGARLRAILREAEAKPKTRQMSAEGRARIAAAQRARWAKQDGAKADGAADGKKAGKMPVGRKGRGAATKATPATKGGSSKGPSKGPSSAASAAAKVAQEQT
jgi:hypothetical protein